MHNEATRFYEDFVIRSVCELSQTAVFMVSRQTHSISKILERVIKDGEKG